MSGGSTIRQPNNEPLAAHARDCEACRAAPLPLEELAIALRAGEIDVDAGALSQQALSRLRPELGRLAHAVRWRRVGLGLLLSLLPLPAVVAYDAYVLRLAYSLACLLVPSGLAAYVVGTYAAFVVLLFAATYAAIPVLVARETHVPVSASG